MDQLLVLVKARSQRTGTDDTLSKDLYVCVYVCVYVKMTERFLAVLAACHGGSYCQNGVVAVV